MNSRPRTSVRYLPLVCLLCVTTVWADKLTDRGATRCGKLFAITPLGVLFDPGCNSAERLTIPLADFASIVFDDNCQPPEHGFISSPLRRPCPGEEDTLFTIAFKESGITTARAMETVTNGQLRITPYQAKTDLVGPIQDVRSIVRGPVCLQRISPSQSPDSFHRASPKKKEKPQE